jgi:prepilin-type N-terminal cleavage/methylation domain-containing protein
VVKTVANKSRSGFTLVEMALAMMLAATLLMTVSASVADALRMQMEANRLMHAYLLASTKMTQFRSGQELTETDQQNEFGRDAGVYRGFRYHVIVRSEQIDLAKVQESGKINGVSAIQDRLPTGVQNQPIRDKAGSSEASVTGGLVDVYRAVVSIQYPRGIEGGNGLYEIQTYMEKKGIK